MNSVPAGSWPRASPAATPRSASRSGRAVKKAAGMARAFGLHAERVTDPARLAGAIRDALANAPALIDVVTTQHALSSDAGKGLGWVPDRQALTAWDEAEQERRR